jgi:hypothetical protein
MSYPRKVCFVSAVVALLSLLFMQLAVSAYACPNLIPAQNAPMLDSSGEPMAYCAGMDEQNPALCYADPHVQKTSLEKPATPSVMPFVAIGFALRLPWPEDDAARPSVRSIFLHAADTPPSIAIRHCFFRL